MKHLLLSALIALFTLLPGLLAAQTFTLVQTPVMDVCGASDWGDYENDGDLDLLVIGDGTFFIYRNNADGSFTALSMPAITGLMNGSVKWIDFNNDGLLDIFTSGFITQFPDQTVCYVYTAKTDGSFETLSLDIQGHGQGAMDWADINNDGFVDMALCGYHELDPHYIGFIFENQAGNTFIESTKYKIEGLIDGSLQWGDYDNDNDPDLVMTGWRWDFINRIDIWETNIYRNDNDSLKKLDAGLKGVTYGSATWGDFDADGDLDLLVSGIQGDHTNEESVFKIYINNGGDNFTEFPTPHIPDIYYNGTTWGDVDNDGDLDILASGRSQDYTIGYTYILINNNGSLTTHSQLCEDQACSMNMVDIDNDGDLDLFLTGWSNFSGHTKLFRTDNSVQNQPPAPPSNLKESREGNKLTFSWDEASDDHTSPISLTYNLYMKSVSENNFLINPYSEPNGFRKIASFGNTSLTNSYSITVDNPDDILWGVQAIDNSFKGSAFVIFQTIQPPIIITDEPTSLNLTEIDLNGRVNPSGQNIEAYFEYGIDTLNLTETSKTLLTGNEFIDLKVHVTHLEYNSLYYYRAVAGNVKGKFVTFLTQPDGIEEGGQNLKFYPNPAKDILKVMLPPNPDGTIIISDIHGTKRMQLQSAQINSSGEIDISSLENGIYNISYTSGNSIWNRKIVKLK